MENEMATFSLGVIGCGAATKRYYVPALKKFKNIIDNIYFVDNNYDRAKDVFEEVGIGEICTDYREILGKIEGAVIVLPHFLHHPVSMEFIKAGVHVLCEKPLAQSANQVIEMIKTAEQNKVELCVNNTRRMFPSFLEVKKIIDSHRIGKIISIEFYEGSVFGWASSTGFYVDPKYSSKGVLLDLGPHVIDLICWWLGKKPELIEYRDDSFGGPESVVQIRAEIENGTIDVFLNRLSDIESGFKVVGEDGVISGRPFDWSKITVKDKSNKETAITLESQAKNYPQFVVPVFENFIGVVKGRESPIISGRDVLSSIEFIEECYENRSRFNLECLDNIKRSPETKKGITLVTGATGFIGGRIVEILHMSKERNVRAGIRQWSSAARLGRFPVDIVMMDLMEKQDIEKALEGVTEIIHCAKGPGKVNAEGTRNLLEVAFEKGIKRFVHLSTAEVYGDVSGDIDENFPFQFTGNEYNKTKIEAEQVCWEYHEKGLPLTVVRPSIVYGPFCQNWSIHFAKMFLKGEWGIYESYGEGKCNLIYVDDLVAAILSILDNEDAVGHAFNIIGPEVISWNQYFDRFNASMGLPPLKKIEYSQARIKTNMMQPVRLLGSIVKKRFFGPVKKVAETFVLADRMMRFVEHSLKTTPGPDELKLFNKKAIFVVGKAKNILRFEPLNNVDSGLNKTIEWMRGQGIL
jgi:predicted dehydrogenase/nucleoside-diphosphate-sugar epimerase